MKEPGKKYNDEDNMLVNDLRSIVSKARSKAFAAVNYSLVERNWRIGQRIVEQEQNGASRAEYGKHVIEVASAALTEEFGKGFSYTNIANYKRFYLTFSDLQILQTLSEEFKKQKHQTLSDESSLLPQKGQTPPAQFELRLLPWSHYERLIRVEDKKAREWYAKEAFNEGWSYRTLNRNINTFIMNVFLCQRRSSQSLTRCKTRQRLINKTNSNTSNQQLSWNFLDCQKTPHLQNQNWRLPSSTT